jgi:hypothetical protein
LEGDLVLVRFDFVDVVYAFDYFGWRVREGEGRREEGGKGRGRPLMRTSVRNWRS